MSMSPFCRTKCVYCDFYSVTGTGLKMHGSPHSEQETALYGGESALFDSLYIGGGTPSLLGERRLASAIRKPCIDHFTFSTDAEITRKQTPTT